MNLFLNIARPNTHTSKIFVLGALLYVCLLSCAGGLYLILWHTPADKALWHSTLAEQSLHLAEQKKLPFTKKQVLAHIAQTHLDQAVNLTPFDPALWDRIAQGFKTQREFIKMREAQTIAGQLRLETPR